MTVFLSSIRRSGILSVYGGIIPAHSDRKRTGMGRLSEIGVEISEKDKARFMRRIPSDGTAPCIGKFIVHLPDGFEKGSVEIAIRSFRSDMLPEAELP